MTPRGWISLELGLSVYLSLLLAAPALGQDFSWAKRVGGAADDASRGVAVDSGGNVYTVGDFSTMADFDPGPGAYYLTSAGLSDIFLSKLDANGSLVWAKRIGGASADSGWGVALDSGANVYIIGQLSGTVDVDPGPGITTLGPGYFAAKFDSAGDFVWAKRWNGGSVEIRGLAVDPGGSVYLAGNFSATTDFDPGSGSFPLTSVGGPDVFVCKLDSSGGFVWAKQMGGTSTDAAFSIAVDSGGNVLTTGFFFGVADFDPGAAAFDLTSAGFQDIFVSKLDSAGDFAWARRMGGGGADQAWSIAVDSAGNVYTTGEFSDTGDFDPGTNFFNLTSAGQTDVFVSKLDGSGAFAWAKRMGGSTTDRGDRIAVRSGVVYTAGEFTGSGDFNPGLSDFVLTSAGGPDLFLSQLDASGGFLEAKRIGGAGIEPPLGLALDSSIGVYLAGPFTSTVDFDPGPGVFTMTAAGGSDVFVAKLGPPNHPPVAEAGPDQTLECTSYAGAIMTLDGSGSFDPDSDPLTYEWTGPFPQGGGTVYGVTPIVTLALGTHTVNLMLEDNRGGVDTDTVAGTVRDTQPPRLLLPTRSIVVGIPPSRTTTTVNVASAFGLRPRDACDPNPLLTIDAPDVFPLGATQVKLTARDKSGNSVEETVTVTVATIMLNVEPATLTYNLRQDYTPFSQRIRIQSVNGSARYTIRPGASWMSATPDHGETNGEVDVIAVTVDPAGIQPGTYTRPLFINSNDAASTIVMITLTVTPAPIPVVRPPIVAEGGVLNAASYTRPGQPGHAVAPGSIVTIFGTNFTDGEQFEADALPLPTELGGVSVTFNDLPAALFSVWPTRIVAQLPARMSGMATVTAEAVESERTVMVVVHSEEKGDSAPREVRVAEFSPAIFTMAQNGRGQGVVLFANTNDLAAPLGLYGNSRPAVAGDILTIYATGLGPVDPPVLNGFNSCAPDGQCLPDYSNVVQRRTVTRPEVYIGGARIPDEDVLFSGLAPEFVGLYVVYVEVGEDAPAGEQVPIVIRMDGVESRGDVTVAVEQVRP